MTARVMLCKGPELPEILRRVSFTPLDVAAETRNLICRNRTSGQDSVYGPAQICSIDRYIVAGPAAIELTAVDQTPLTIEEKEIRRTRRMIGFGHTLRFIEEVREYIANLTDFFPHLFRAVIR